VRGFPGELPGEGGLRGMEGFTTGANFLNWGVPSRASLSCSVAPTWLGFRDCCATGDFVTVEVAMAVERIGFSLK